MNTLLHSTLRRPTINRIGRPAIVTTLLQIRSKRTVRVILQKNLPTGEVLAGEVAHVTAGYARNFLIPQKYGLYATRENFANLGIKDPEKESVAEKRVRLAREEASRALLFDRDLKEAERLKKYLRNKKVKMLRRVDPETDMVSPGKVVAENLRPKLKKQLKIELEPHEQIHLMAQDVKHESLTDELIEEYMETKFGDHRQPCTVELKQLGQYLARITLRGGYTVGLMFEIQNRVNPKKKTDESQGEEGGGAEKIAAESELAEKGKEVPLESSYANAGKDVLKSLSSKKDRNNAKEKKGNEES